LVQIVSSCFLMHIPSPLLFSAALCLSTLAVCAAHAVGRDHEQTEAAIGVSARSLADEEQSHKRTQLEVSRRIWDGDNVEIREVADSMAFGPFPAFVSLVYKGRDSGELKTCGGSLYRRRFILTAAHCVTNDPAKYVLHAHLNPYRNPEVVDAALIVSNQSLERYDALVYNTSATLTPDWNFWLKVFPDVEAFRKEIGRGLGVPLRVKQPTRGSTTYGFVHTEYASRAKYDVGVIPLEAEPFDAGFRLWRYIDVELDRGRLPASATAYGNGRTNPEKATCGYLGNNFNCFLQQRRVEVLSLRECQKKLILAAVLIMTKSDMASYVQRLIGVISHSVPGVKGKVLKTQAASLLRLMNDLISFAQSSHDVQEAKLETLSEQLEQAKYFFVSDIYLNWYGEVREGRQACVMSPERTGSMQYGDSGGPLVTADGKLLAVFSWSLQGNGTGREHNLETVFGQPLQMPSFFSRMSYFGVGIDKVLDCLMHGKEWRPGAGWVGLGRRKVGWDDACLKLRSAWVGRTHA